MKKELGLLNKKGLAILICFVLTFSFVACGKEKSYDYAAQMIAWFTQGNYSSYTFKTIEEGTDENGLTYVYIVADYDDAYGQGTTSGVLFLGTGGYKFVHVDDYEIEYLRPYLDSYYKLRDEDKVTQYSDEEVSRILELAKEYS